MSSNVYFRLTEEMNAEGTVALLSSGQAVVFYRIAMMSKDGDWVVRETEEACQRVLRVMQDHGAHYRPGAPLDVRWLAGGWSSHFEWVDERSRRVRCDFVTRPPRVPADQLDALFREARGSGPLRVVDPERLTALKRTQRAKDYPVIAEIARLLGPAREMELTTDPDRVLALAAEVSAGSTRECVRLARAGAGRDAVVVALAREVDRLQGEDRSRLAAYEAAAGPYLLEFRRRDLGRAPLPEAHAQVVALAERLLPPWPGH